jgi:hypothetical protein
VNSSYNDGTPCISRDGLSLYFASTRPGGEGYHDLWVTTRASINDEWSEPVHLGGAINSGAQDYGPTISGDDLTMYFRSNRWDGLGSGDIWVSTRSSKDAAWPAAVNAGAGISSSSDECMPHISADGLELYFGSTRSGGYGDHDIYVVTRPTTAGPWSDPVNLGPAVNSAAVDANPCLSLDGLTLIFSSKRSDGYGNHDLYMTTRLSRQDPWSAPTNLGEDINTAYDEMTPSFWAEGAVIYFSSWEENRPGALGGADIWLVQITPFVDFNGDWVVDFKDFCEIGRSWGQADPLADVGPTAFGDGLVDIKDVVAFAGSWLWRITEEACQPNPGDGATEVAAQTTVALSWKIGEALDTQDCTVTYTVYFGSDAETLGELDTVEQTNYDFSGRFRPLTTYYWRVDTNRTLNVPPFDTVVITGNIWSFTTAG